MHNYNSKYLELIARHWEKNKVCIKKGIGLLGDKPLTLAVEKHRSLEWFQVMFDLCDKVNTSFDENDFKAALENKEFKKIGKECQSLVKENYVKHYAQAVK